MRMKMWPHGIAAVPFQFMIVLLLLLICIDLKNYASAAENRDEGSSYIVYLGHHGNRDKDLIVNQHLELLSLVKGRIGIERASEYILYHYKHSFSGFAATLTADEVDQLSRMEEVVSVFPSAGFGLHTTRSWEFLGLANPITDMNNKTYSSEIWDLAKQGQDVIIGVVDTGIWPESESFRDDGMEAVPAADSWKGECEVGQRFDKSNCNRKIIGVRSFLTGFEKRRGPVQMNFRNPRSARDTVGHGTHVAAIAAGRIVQNVTGYGGEIAEGTATGGFPFARLAIYKACWWWYVQEPFTECVSEDILAAMDSAVGDGVHVMSVSLGGKLDREAAQLHKDPIVIAGLHALQAGILVTTSAGNDGPAPRTLSHHAPWLFTVGATSTDRSFLASVELGIGLVLQGDSQTSFAHIQGRSYRLVRGRSVLRHDLDENSRQLALARECGLRNSLNASKVKDSIVFCQSPADEDHLDPYRQSLLVKRAGGVAMIYGRNDRNPIRFMTSYEVPVIFLAPHASTTIQDYIGDGNMHRSAKFSPLTTIQPTKPSPVVAIFSSQGPSEILPNILKPEICAPGVQILSAWSRAIGPSSQVQVDNRKAEYNIVSGSSMACPHVTAVTALLKSIHPSWSPSAIKSAIMTTASNVDNDGEPIKAYAGSEFDSVAHLVLANPFSLGAGQIDPKRAVDPGLIYDATPDDYHAFLCNIGYNETTLRRMSGSNVTKCPETLGEMNDLNQPSVVMELSMFHTTSVVRKVTNVGANNSTYDGLLLHPQSNAVEVEIEPRRLEFTEIGQTLTFTVHATLTEPPDEAFHFGSLIWVEDQGDHNVRIPIILKT